MSPSFKTLLREGMPWTTSLLIDVHSTQGNSYRPLNAGCAPLRNILSSAAFSRSYVEMPGATIERNSSSTSQSSKPPRRILSISSGDLQIIMSRKSGDLQQATQCIHDLLRALVRIDLETLPVLPVKI